MADNEGGVRWWLRLLLDKRSKDQVQREAQEALDKGTDPKKAKRNVREVEGAFDRLKKAAVKVGAVLASLWVVRQVANYAKAVFDLGSQVLAVGNQFDTVFGDGLGGLLRERTEDLRLMAGLTRRQAQELLAGAGSMAQGFGMSQQAAADFSQQVLELSADLASFNNVPTADAAQLVQSALIGNTEAARSLKINFTALDVTNRALANTGKSAAASLTQEEKALAALEVMAERAGPQIGDLNRTQNDSDNVAKQLAGSYAQVKESLAAVLVSSTSGELGLSRLRDLFRDLDRWVRQNAEAIGAWASFSITAVTQVGKFIGNTVRAFFNLGQIGGDLLVGVVSAAVGAIMTLVNGAGEAINWMIEQANRLPGIDIDFRFGNLPADRFFEVSENAFRSMADQARDVHSSVEGAAGAVAALGRALREAAGAQGELNAAKQRDPDRTTTTTTGGGAADVAAGAGIDPRAAAGFADASAAIFASMMGGGSMSRLADEGEDAAFRLESAFSGAAHTMTDAFAQFFEAGATGFEDMGDVAANVGATIIEGMTRHAAQWQMAEGAADLAGGSWPPNPAQLAAASLHFAAAGAFRALGPAVAASVSSSGGIPGGRGGMATGAFDAGGRTADRMAPGGPDVHIYIDPLDPYNPAYQSNAYAATQFARERFGENSRISVHPARAGRP